MKLLTKFNLILLVTFGAGGILISQLAYRFLIGNARREVLAQAELMMASASSVRDYTSDVLSPLLQQNPRHKVRFLAETVPAFGATRMFANLRKSYPDYTYKEATLNPTNPEDRASDWEADLIREMRDHPERNSITGERNTPSGESLYLAKALKVGAPCLECHSIPSTAPVAMLAVYGSANGFGWKQGETIAAQIVSVPMSVPVQIAKQAYYLLIWFLAVILLTAILVLDLAVYCLVIRPLKVVSETADRVSRGAKDIPILAANGKDEIAVVTASFNRMQLSLAKAFKMLDEQ